MLRKIRKIRGPLIGLVAGAILTLSGQALADIPDTHPSSPDPAHTFYGCVYPKGSTSPLQTFYALDKTYGDCPSNMVEVRLVPSATP
jgi:hypothetical protein